jgi:hypothetical protein
MAGPTISRLSPIPLPHCSRYWNIVVNRGRLEWTIVVDLDHAVLLTLMGAQEARELASLAVLEQGLCKRDADDPAGKRFSFPER